jgi:zinc protease
LHPDEIKLLVIGDKDKFDKPLGEFGEVNIIELE